MEGIRIDNNDAKTNLTKAAISNSSVQECSTGIKKVNIGTATISGSNIYSNKYGIDNKGTCILSPAMSIPTLTAEEITERCICQVERSTPILMMGSEMPEPQYFRWYD